MNNGVLLENLLLSHQKPNNVTGAMFEHRCEETILAAMVKHSHAVRSKEWHVEDKCQQTDLSTLSG